MTESSSERQITKPSAPTSIQRPGAGGITWLSVGLVGYSFVVSLFAPSWLRFGGNIALALVLVAFRHRLGLSNGEIGLSSDAARRGLAVGSILSAALLLAIIGGSLEFPERAAEFANEEELPASRLLLLSEVLVRIPFETAATEEILFRGIIYGLWRKRFGLWAALAGSSLAYSLWHIGPTLSGRDTPFALEGMVVDLAGPLGLTLILGLLYVGLRNWTHGVVGPAIVHTAQNGGLMIAGYITVHGAF